MNRRQELEKELADLKEKERDLREEALMERANGNIVHQYLICQRHVVEFIQQHQPRVDRWDSVDHMTTCATSRFHAGWSLTVLALSFDNSPLKIMFKADHTVARPVFMFCVENSQEYHRFYFEYFCTQKDIDDEYWPKCAPQHMLSLCKLLLQRDDISHKAYCNTLMTFLQFIQQFICHFLTETAIDEEQREINNRLLSYLIPGGFHGVHCNESVAGTVVTYGSLC